MGRSLHAKIPSTGGALGSTALGIGQFEGSRDNQSHQWKSWKKSDLWCQSWSRVCRTILFQPTHGGLAWCYPCVGTGWSREPWHILQPFTMRLLGGISPSKPRGWAPQIASWLQTLNIWFIWLMWHDISEHPGFQWQMQSKACQCRSIWQIPRGTPSESLGRGPVVWFCLPNHHLRNFLVDDPV